MNGYIPNMNGPVVIQQTHPPPPAAIIPNGGLPNGGLMMYHGHQLPQQPPPPSDGPDMSINHSPMVLVSNDHPNGSQNPNHGNNVINLLATNHQINGGQPSISSHAYYNPHHHLNQQQQQESFFYQQSSNNPVNNRLQISASQYQQNPSPLSSPNNLQQLQRAARVVRTPNGTLKTMTMPATATGSQRKRNPNLRKPPPPMCIDCCLSCCGITGVWYYNELSTVIALICNLLVDLMMFLCLLSTNWLTTTKYRQGLWQYCIDVGSPRPLPFNLNDHDGCHWGRDVAYIRFSGLFAVGCLLLALFATILTSIGLSSRDPNKKYTYYRFALYINIGALLSIIVSLTLYPAFFYFELYHTTMIPANRPHWYFGWAYGVGWGGAIFLIGAILLLVCDKETEEIYYQERTIVHANHHHHHHLNLTNNPNNHSMKGR